VLTAIVAVTLIAGIAYVKVSDTKAIAAMVAGGADPQAAACAVGSVNVSTNTICSTLAIQKSNKQ
jgi:hypothetical protein